MASFPAPKSKEALYLALSQIPEGMLVTYGQLARMAGLPGAARLAGNVLHALPPGTGLAWHRVINAQGKISLPLNSPAYQEQILRLRAEGVEVINGKVNLQRFGWRG